MPICRDYKARRNNDRFDRLNQSLLPIWRVGRIRFHICWTGRRGTTARRPSSSGGNMRHPALRRSARHSSRREARAEAAKQAADQTPDAANAHDPAAQNRPAPGVPPDGDHNQGGARSEGMDYQRDLGSEQDA
jgi:hypothetical protein